MNYLHLANDTNGPLAEIFSQVEKEYWRAKAKHGEMTLDGSGITDLLRLAVLMEEVGEAAAEITYDKVSDNTSKLKKELIQVANVALTWASIL